MYWYDKTVTKTRPEVEAGQSGSGWRGQSFWMKPVMNRKNDKIDDRFDFHGLFYSILAPLATFCLIWNLIITVA